MIFLKEAINIVLSSGITTETEHVGFLEALNRILAEDIIADIDMPPFDKSAVDGFACRKDDMFNELEVIEIIAAGKLPEKPIESNQCSKIMTGAPIPQGADAVLMVEDVEQASENFIRYKKNKVNQNICLKGEDIAKGQVVLTAGTRIKPQHLAVMATLGCVKPLVHRKIKVAIISTGNELVEPETIPALSQIRNSNAYQLLAQAQQAGSCAEYLGIALDTEASIRIFLNEGFEKADIVLITGGVSMGDYDYVPKVLNELGAEIKFKSIAIQPGRPTLFGTKSGKYIYGLPGNPVSSFVQFELLVKPLISKLSGNPYTPVNLRIPIAEDYERKKSDRLSVIPACIQENGTVLPLEYHGSAHINSYTEAHGLLFIPVGQTKLKKGELTDVRLIQ